MAHDDHLLSVLSFTDDLLKQSDSQVPLAEKHLINIYTCFMIKEQL